MYTFDSSTWSVGEPRPYYGHGEIEPERFTAELALRDLSGPGGERDAALILARYAVLRAWWLATGPTDARLQDHAVAAAREYLAAASEGWPERPLLGRVVDRPRAANASDVLMEVAIEAERRGHIDGAYAARTGAWAAEVRAVRLDAAAGIAAHTAAFLRRWGGTADAVAWDDVARRLRRGASGWGRPSTS